MEWEGRIRIRQTPSLVVIVAPLALAVRLLVVLGYGDAEIHKPPDVGDVVILGHVDAEGGTDQERKTAPDQSHR